MTWLTATEYLCHKWICSVCRKHTRVLSWLITGFVTEKHDGCHMWNRKCLPFRSPECTSVFCYWIRVARSLAFCVMFCRPLFVLLSFFFCPLCCLSFWLPLWYLQKTFLIKHNDHCRYTYIVIGRDKSYFVIKSTIILTAGSMKPISSKCSRLWLATYLLYVVDVFDIPMVTNRVPPLADLFLYSYETYFI